MGEQGIFQVRIKKQGDWALKCTSGHDLEKQFIGTINDAVLSTLVWCLCGKMLLLI